MTVPIDPTGLGGTLAEVVAALGRAQAASDDQSEQEPTIGRGEAVDGRVRARAVPLGRIENLELDPSVLRLSGEKLAQGIESAGQGREVRLFIGTVKGGPGRTSPNGGARRPAPTCRDHPAFPRRAWQRTP
jgi:hypothetical protein